MGLCDSLADVFPWQPSTVKTQANPVSAGKGPVTVALASTQLT